MSFSSSRVVFRWRKRPLLFYCHVKSVQLCHAGLVLNSHTEPSPNCPHTPNCHAELVLSISSSCQCQPTQHYSPPTHTKLSCRTCFSISSSCQCQPTQHYSPPTHTKLSCRTCFGISYIFLPSCHTGLVPHCHAELVSASHIFCKQKQADKWNNEILKQVQDDISFLSSFLGLT